MVVVYKFIKCNTIKKVFFNIKYSIILFSLIVIFLTTSCDNKSVANVTETTIEETKTLALELGIDINDYKYILANIDNSIGDYTPELVEIENGRKFDKRAAEYLKSFINDARAEGLSVFLSSTYRGKYSQKMLYDRKVSQYGEEEAKTIVLPPGTSEHQTGLAADITDVYYEFKTKEIENTDTFKWLNDHCQDYGFILRYPKDKEAITKVIYEPWHFRFVGNVAAKYIKEHNLCLEEFLELLKNS